MEAVSIPNVTEYVETRTLPKGRVSTTVSWFMLNDIVFDAICSGFIKGEVSIVECRIGTSIKHPSDTYNKKVALDTARARIGKNKLEIISITATKHSTQILLKDYTLEKFQNGKVIVKGRPIYEW
jgi:hypothetical protein